MKSMVIGIATGLLGLGLALPTGLAFGFGYGYGVRQGYSAFKPPSKTANDLKMSLDPIQGSLGMGLQTAEERTNVKTPVQLTTGPSLQQTEPIISDTAPKKFAPTIQQKLDSSGIKDRDKYYAYKRQLETRKQVKYSQYKRKRLNTRSNFRY